MYGSGASEGRLIDDVIILYNPVLNPVLNCTPGSDSVQHPPQLQHREAQTLSGTGINSISRPMVSHCSTGMTRVKSPTEALGKSIRNVGLC